MAKTVLWTAKGGSTAEGKKRHEEQKSSGGSKISGGSASSAPSAERDRMIAEQKAKLLSGVAQQETKSGAYLRGETVKTSTGASINIADDTGLTGQPGTMPALPPAGFGAQTSPYDNGLGVSSAFGTTSSTPSRFTSPDKRADILAAFREREAGKDFGEKFNEIISMPGGVGVMLGAVIPPGWSFGGSTGNILTNTKTADLATGAVTKGLSLKTLLAAGGTIAAAASAMFLGMWGQAEAPEPLSIVMRDVLYEAKKTGDFTIYDEAKEARDEIVNLSIWEKILMWTPFSPLIGVPNKIEGVKAGAIIMDKAAADVQMRQNTGQSDEDYWIQRDAERAQQEKDLIDYYNNERLKTESELAKLREAANERADVRALSDTRKQISYWEDYAARQRALEEADRIAQAEFWFEYRKLMLKMQEDSRPSKLNFGIL